MEIIFELFLEPARAPERRGAFGHDGANRRDCPCDEPKHLPEPFALPAPLFNDPEAPARFCRQHRIRRLSLFGSSLKDLSRADRDVDLLVEFEPGARPGLPTLAQIQLELSKLLGGLELDLRTAEDLSARFRDELVSTAAPQHEG